MRQFWVINISNVDIHLSDLNICIPAGKHINIMNLNHDLTEEQIHRSEMKGSIASNVAKKRILINYSEPKFVSGAPKLKQSRKPWPQRMKVAKKAAEIDEPDLLFSEEVEKHAEKMAALLAGEKED